jgi:ascorbate-specific PTS system EIIC-type component UlaA
MNAAADAKIKMLENSIRCLVCGMLGLLPVIGLPFALAALVLSAKVRARQKKNWNAAKPYLVWGVVCAAAGAIFWGFILTIIIYRAANPY